MSLPTHEAVILGGGLAGLCLALQLRGEFPDMDILVLERLRHPLPAAAHKVGESTVEIAADYFDNTLGLRDHMDAAHIRKFGLRYFFSHGRDDIANVTELGVSRILPVPSYQIDRGVFETFLGAEARRRGITFRDGATVKTFSVGTHGAAHEVSYVDDAGEHRVSARWLLDASGRAALLRRRFELTLDNGHHANAVWFRMDTRLDIDRWSDDADWHARCTPPERWRSTNHLMGPGYWAWLIPLGSGRIRWASSRMRRCIHWTACAISNARWAGCTRTSRRWAVRSPPSATACSISASCATTRTTAASCFPPTAGR